MHAFQSSGFILAERPLKAETFRKNKPAGRRLQILCLLPLGYDQTRRIAA